MYGGADLYEDCGRIQCVLIVLYPHIGPIDNDVRDRARVHALARASSVPFHLHN
jgi:hypothetical protein